MLMVMCRCFRHLRNPKPLYRDTCEALLRDESDNLEVNDLTLLSVV